MSEVARNYFKCSSCELVAPYHSFGRETKLSKSLVSVESHHTQGLRLLCGRFMQLRYRVRRHEFSPQTYVECRFIMYITTLYAVFWRMPMSCKTHSPLTQSHSSLGHTAPCATRQCV